MGTQIMRNPKKKGITEKIHYYKKLLELTLLIACLKIKEVKGQYFFPRD
jgi:hypothetical protein